MFRVKLVVAGFAILCLAYCCGLLFLFPHTGSSVEELTPAYAEKIAVSYKRLHAPPDARELHYYYIKGDMSLGATTIGMHRNTCFTEGVFKERNDVFDFIYAHELAHFSRYMNHIPDPAQDHWKVDRDAAYMTSKNAALLSLRDSKRYYGCGEEGIKQILYWWMYDSVCGGLDSRIQKIVAM